MPPAVTAWVHAVLLHLHQRCGMFACGRHLAVQLPSPQNVNDRGGRSSRFPISKFALGRRDRRPVVFSYRGFVYFFKAAECALYRSETLGSYEIRM